jgi:hypothetical protein
MMWKIEFEDDTQLRRLCFAGLSRERTPTKKSAQRGKHAPNSPHNLR